VEAASESPTARRVIAGLSAVVFLAVAVVLYAIPRHVAPFVGEPDALATVNASLNAGAAVCLLLGYAFIKQKRILLHRAAMSTAFVLSSIFLVTYLVHHARVGSVPFREHGWVRAAYFGVLVPHVLLAAVIVPLALVTLRRGWIRDIARHRSIARRTLPIWLYVSMSGVLLYWMLYR
jgi:putative membrane protein